MRLIILVHTAKRACHDMRDYELFFCCRLVTSQLSVQTLVGRSRRDLLGKANFGQ